MFPDQSKDFISRLNSKRTQSSESNGYRQLGDQGCLPQILLDPFLNTSTQLLLLGLSGKSMSEHIAKYLKQIIICSKNIHVIAKTLYVEHTSNLFGCRKLIQTHKFFYLGFLSQTFTIHRTAGKGEAFSLSSLHPIHPLQRHLDISEAIAAESSPLHIASSRTRIGNFCFKSLNH